MSAYFRPQPAATRRRRQPFQIWPLAVLALSLPISGCAAGSAERASEATDVADPTARVPATGYRSAFRGYESQRPVEPLPWRERNENVAPKPKTGDR